jgi:hypothetical protein
MKLLINYSDKHFRRSQKLNSRTGIAAGGFDRVISYGPKDIAPAFYAKNEKILSQLRGGGYWLWKPYFIERSLRLLNEGDFLFYSDSGAYFVGSVEPLIKISTDSGRDLIPFELVFVEKHWTKRDAFVLMGCDSPEYIETRQRQGSFSLWRKSPFTDAFIQEFLRLAQDERLITDMENTMGLPNYPGFNEHRHDQSIFSLLTKRHRLPAYRIPSQYGNGLKQRYPDSIYDQIIQHTRARNRPFLLRGALALKSIVERHGGRRRG